MVKTKKCQESVLSFYATAFATLISDRRGDLLIAFTKHEDILVLFVKFIRFGELVNLVNFF